MQDICGVGMRPKEHDVLYKMGTLSNKFCESRLISCTALNYSYTRGETCE